MDAAYTTLKKAVLFLSFTLVSLGFWGSPANAQSISVCATVGLNSQTFQATCTISSTGNDIPYTGRITYLDAVTNWLSVNPLNGTATSGGALMSFTAGGASLDANPGSHSARVILTPTSAGATGATITVTYTPGNGSGGGGTSGAITASSLQTFCPSGCANTQSLTLSTTSTTAIPFSISAPSWLGIYQASGVSGSVSSSTPAVFTVYINNFSAVTSSQNIVVSYSNTTLNIPIPATGSSTGNGVISPNPSTLNLCYTTGGSVPTGVVNFTDTSSPTYFQASSTVTTSGDPTWLLISAPGTGSGGSTSFGYVQVSTVGTSFNVLVNSSVLSQLTSGAHNGTITITDYPGNNQATVSVVLNVNNGASCASGTGGLTVTPSSIQLPSVALNSTATVTSSATVSVASPAHLLLPPRPAPATESMRASAIPL